MKIVRVTILLLLLSVLLCVSAFGVSVEQTQICMPKIDLYVYEDGQDLSQIGVGEITATLDGEPLKVRDMGRSEQGVFYVCMLDVSASMPAGHFDAAKQALLGARSRLRPQDGMALIAFGNEVSVLLEGGESRDALEKALERLENRDKNTVLYNAMDVLVDMMLQTKDMRRVAVVITDGLDDAQGGISRSELEEKLVRSGVSVSAMCIDTVSGQKAKSFAEFIRLSGGEFYLFGPSDAREVMESLMDRLDAGWHIELEASSNIASGKDSLLRVDFGGKDLLEITVVPELWTPDDIPPFVEKVSYRPESNSILVTFSEPVVGALNPEAYVLADGAGAAVDIETPEAVDEFSVLLTLSRPPAEGAGLSITIRGITDLSMEKNPLPEYADVILPKAPEPAETQEAAAETDGEPLVGQGTIIVMAALLVLVAAAAAVILKMSQSRYGGKKGKPEKKQKIKPVQGKQETRFLFLTDEEDEKNGRK